jgi:hypothetical protein
MESVSTLEFLDEVILWSNFISLSTMETNQIHLVATLVEKIVLIGYKALPPMLYDFTNKVPLSTTKFFGFCFASKMGKIIQHPNCPLIWLRKKINRFTKILD